MWRPTLNPRSLGGKLFLTGAVILLITAAAVALLGYHQAYRATLDEAKRHVLSIVLERRARLEEWMGGRAATLEAAVGGLTSRHGTQLPGNAAAREQFLRRLAAMDPRGVLLSQEIIEPGSADVPPLHRAVAREALARGRAVYGEVHLHEDGEAAISLALPLRNASGQPAAVLLQDLRASRTIDPLLADTTGLGQSGEVYLIGTDLVMLTPSRFHNHPQPLTHKMPIPPVYPALEGKTGSMMYKGFLGQEVVGAYTFLPSMHWAVIAEMRSSEALAPLRKIVVNTTAAAVVALLLLLGVTMLLARTWSEPLERLGAASHRVARGDYSIQLPEGRRQDEIGDLVRDFNAMVADLAGQQEDLQHQQRRLVQSERMAAIGTLAAGIVHEMRNPLSSVKMNLRLLERRLSEDERSSEHIALASGEVDRLERMFSELLDYSKPTVFARVEFELAPLLSRALEQVRPAAREAGIGLEAPAPSLTTLTGDPEQLLRTLVNLLSNALQACQKGDRVTLSARPDEGDRVRIEVEDNGRGMSDTVRERLFDPFFTTREEGIGLGMSNVHKFVDRVEGTLEITSSEGEGTTVTLLLPMEMSDGDPAGH